MIGIASCMAGGGGEGGGGLQTAAAAAAPKWLRDLKKRVVLTAAARDLWFCLMPCVLMCKLSNCPVPSMPWQVRCACMPEQCISFAGLCGGCWYLYRDFLML
jgi:hypothetical protein